MKVRFSSEQLFEITNDNWCSNFCVELFYCYCVNLHSVELCYLCYICLKMRNSLLYSAYANWKIRYWGNAGHQTDIQKPILPGIYFTPGPFSKIISSFTVSQLHVCNLSWSPKGKFSRLHFNDNISSSIFIITQAYEMNNIIEKSHLRMYFFFSSNIIFTISFF